MDAQDLGYRNDRIGPTVYVYRLRSTMPPVLTRKDRLRLRCELALRIRQDMIARGGVQFKSRQEIALYMNSLSWVQNLEDRGLIDRVVDIAARLFDNKMLVLGDSEFECRRRMCSADIRGVLREVMDQRDVETIMEANLSNEFFVALQASPELRRVSYCRRVMLYFRSFFCR